MPYVTTIEQRGIEKGREQGLEQGWRQASEDFALRFLHHQFGELNEETKAVIRALSLDRLTELSHLMFNFASLEDLFVWLRNNQPAPAET